MVIWDGSPHQWFGPDEPPCCLMTAKDDATGKLIAAQFFAFEGTAGIYGFSKRWSTTTGFLCQFIRIGMEVFTAMMIIGLWRSS